MTRAGFYAPVRPPQPGQRPAQFGPTAATDLLTALAALRNTQNNFMGVWLNYHAARMRLERELGTMQLDRDGGWVDHPVPNSRGADASGSDVSNLPPAVPAEWIELADRLPEIQEQPNASASAAVEAGDGLVQADIQRAERVKETDHVD